MSLKIFSIHHEIRIQSSLYELSYHIVTHMLAVFVLMLPMKIPVWVTVLLFLMVLTSAAYYLLWKPFKQNKAIKLICQSDGSFSIIYKNRQINSLQLQITKAYLSGWIIILPFTANARRRSIILWRDSISYSDWRLLHALIRQLANTGISSDSRVLTKL